MRERERTYQEIERKMERWPAACGKMADGWLHACEREIAAGRAGGRRREGEGKGRETVCLRISSEAR